MNKFSHIIALSLIFTASSLAQDVPKAEVYLGYSYMRTATATQVNAFNNNGGLSSFQYNFNKDLAVVGELGGYQAGDVSIHGPSFGTLDSTFFSYQFGPRVSINKAGRVTPFVHYLVGGVHESRSFNVPTALIPPGTQFPPDLKVEMGNQFTKFRSTQNAFAMTIGGGFDVKLSQLIAIRPAQVDYMPSHFSPFNVPGVPGSVNNTRWQHNLRYSAGITFRFGGGAISSPTAFLDSSSSQPAYKRAPLQTNLTPSAQ